MKAIRAYVLAYPLLLVFGFLATYLVARLALGYWPRASVDDPKYIGYSVAVPYLITAFLLVVGLPAFAAGILSLVYRAYCDEARRKVLLGLSVLSAGCMIAAIALIHWDPLEIVAWYFD